MEKITEALGGKTADVLKECFDHIEFVVADYLTQASPEYGIGLTEDTIDALTIGIKDKILRMLREENYIVFHNKQLPEVLTEELNRREQGMNTLVLLWVAYLNTLGEGVTIPRNMLVAASQHALQVEESLENGTITLSVKEFANG